MTVEAALRAPVASVAFADGKPVPVREVRILQQEYHHERAQVTVDLASPSSKRYRSGAPVRIIWGHDPVGLNTFVGYVNHATPEHSPVKDRSDRGGFLKVVCVAPSWIFKDGGYATFRNVSASSAVKKLGESQRFDVRHVEAHTALWPVLHQQGRSYWEFMVECAKRVGWTLYARGLELYCLDRKRSAQLDRQPPLLRSEAIGGGVREFRPKVGATAPGGQLLVREGYTVNPRNNAVLYARDSGGTEKALFNTPSLSPMFHRGMTDATFDSLGEGYGKLQAGAKGSQLAVEATLLTGLRPSLRAGGPALLEGFGDGSDGGWYVSAVEHVIRPGGRASSTATVGRDTARSDTFLVPQAMGASPPPRGARLVNGQWVTA